ncbi:MAG TPA: tail fiber domain-containing protein [Thermoanaerobaculia bacterium]|nr:tail fiber domain-containing protein [Thermoanaerobaculia bacterium]
MRPKYRFSLLFLVAAFAGFADEQPRAARLVPTNRAIEWHSPIDSTAFLSVQRPDGEVITETFAAGRTPMLPLEGLADGVYSYELHIERAPAQSGSFTIANGAIVPPHALERVPVRKNPAVETLFTDDVSAKGGVCAGADCTGTESYAGVTLKLKANNTRLKFEDTSTAAGFASTDWQLSANDSASGGANKFFVEDLAAGTDPFVIEGGSPSNTLYVDSNGRIGIRTANPFRDLTIANPISTIIRMEQSASPFQAWEIVANNNNFYVRDVNHEQNPFIIKSSAPYNSVVIDSTGRIGLGVASPLYQIDHSSGARLDAGNWVNASSRNVKQDLHQLDGDTAVDALKALEPVTFAYKANPGETHVGFIAEDVPALVATSDRAGLSSMDVVAVLTKVIQEQQRTIEEMQRRLAHLEQNE